MRHLTVLSSLLLAALANAQAPSPTPTPPTGQPPAPAPPPAPPGPMSNSPNPANPAATPAAVSPAAAVSIKEGAPVAAGAARIYNVMVGGAAAASKLSFQPEAVSAKPGDVIKFTFMDADNSVVQTTFEQPCAQKAGGFSAGPMQNATGAMPGPTQELKIENGDPLYMTSKAVGACGRGMLFVVNAPTTGDKSQAAFKMAAIKAGGVQFKQDALVVDQPVPQAASTISVNVGAGGNGGNIAAGQTPQGAQPNLPQGTVVPGQGTLGNGQPCGCNCLCGAGQPVPAGAAQGSFGGFAGVNPNAVGAMAPPPAGRQ